MNVLFRAIGMSKQSFHQRLNRQMLFLQEMGQVLALVEQIRLDHPRMSSRKMYRMIKPKHVGRDRFEAFCFTNGYKIATKRSYHRTTNSLGVTRFENLLLGFELTGINQVWVSDITYYRIGEQFYYLTFMLDLYSRLIVGYSVSADLSTIFTTIPALQLALTIRKDLNELIVHSDGGGQYYCKDWLKLTSQYQIRSSMCESVYENPHAERINGVIKNDYLVGYNPQDYTQLITMTSKAVMKYNVEKPHESLANISPDQYEKLSLGEQALIHMTLKRKKVPKKEKTQEYG